MNKATPAQTGYYSISGVVIRAGVDDLPQVAARLAGLPGVDVHHLEASTGRVVITLETSDHEHEEACLERVRRETGVLSAELVCHYVEPPGKGPAPDHHSTRGAA